MSRAKEHTCQIIRPGGSYEGRQGLNYFEGLSAESVGAQGLCMHLVRLPPGARARAHLHENHETAIYVLRGEVEMLYGEDLEEHLVVRAGEFLYIPAGVPHLPYNASSSEAVGLLARTDPNEQESVVLLPELESEEQPNVSTAGASAHPTSGSAPDLIQSGEDVIKPLKGFEV